MGTGVPGGNNGGVNPIQPIPNDVSSQEDGEEVSSGPSFGSLVSPTGISASGKPSPMSAAQSSQPAMPPGKVTTENFVMNVSNLLGQMKGLQAGLQTPNLQLNARTRKLLDAKLKRTHENIRFISAKANVGEEDADREREGNGGKIPAAGEDDNQSAIARFIGYLTDGQSQLESVMKNTSRLGNKDSGIQMQNLFSMQVKLYRAQVEIEFSSAVLQKAMDDLKTIMSVQF